MAKKILNKAVVKDDWRSETQLRLQQSLLYQTLRKKSKKDPSGIHVISLVDNAVYDSYHRTKMVIRHMGEYTLHDGDHLFRVLTLMERLLPVSKIETLTIPEIMLLILTAFFHDIGMAPDEKEVIAWKKVWDTTHTFSTKEEEESFKKFNRFYQARPEKQNEIKQLLNEGKVSTADLIKGYLISDYIRQTHADRAREIIFKEYNGKIVYRECDLTSEFAQICFSHNEDSLSLLELDKDFLCGPDTYACLPLVGIILRLADILDFDAKRTPPILYSHLNVRHPISIQEWNKHRSVQAWNINPHFIQFNVRCAHPAIEASIHSFCDIIDKELSTCNNIISAIGEPLSSLKFPFKVNRDKIETRKDLYGKPLYIYRETQFNLSKRQVLDLLMGTKLYGDPQVALRELIQNSIDACLLRQALEKKWGNIYFPEIEVKYYEEDNDYILEVIDNGTGMDQYIIDTYYSKVGSSFYKSTDFYDLKNQSNADFTPTSRFGIGILSCFMVADSLLVDTRKVYAPHKSSDPLSITVEGQESIFWIKEGLRETPGTSTKLLLRKTKNPWDNMTEEEFIKSVETIVPNPPFKIAIKTTSFEKLRDEKSFSLVNASELRDYTWNENENIKMFAVAFNEVDSGITGSAVVAILQTGGSPTDLVELNEREIEIEGSSYTLGKKIRLSENKIIEDSDSITINDEGEINEESSTRYLATSKSKISLHGIEVPTSLFPESWNMKANQVKLSFPFPLIIVVDISGHRDLDLNSSRTQIIMSDKWMDFEEALSYSLCLGIAKQTTKKYWNSLRKILSKASRNERFITGLNKVQIK
jgi:molecular chaperone HtpG